MTEPTPHNPLKDAQQQIHAVLEETALLARKLFGEALQPEHVLSLVNLILSHADSLVANPKDGLAETFRDFVKLLPELLTKFPPPPSPADLAAVLPPKDPTPSS